MIFKNQKLTTFSTKFYKTRLLKSCPAIVVIQNIEVPQNKRQIASHSSLNDDLKTTLPKSFPVNSFLFCPYEQYVTFMVYSKMGKYSDKRIKGTDQNSFKNS